MRARLHLQPAAEPAHLLIAYAGAWEIRKAAPKAPVFAAVREGQRLGKACPRLAELAIRDLLPLPLDEARAKLNITPARHYKECHRIWRELGVDPYDVLGRGTARETQRRPDPFPRHASEGWHLEPSARRLRPQLSLG